MPLDLDELRISIKEMERLTGFEVNEIFIGSVLGGVCRPSLFQNPKRLTYFCITEIFILTVTFIFALPFGFLFIRNSQNAITDLNTIFKFLLIPLVITVVVNISWNLYMLLKVRSMRTLANLLDEVDKYNEIIQAIAVLDRIEAIGNLQVNTIYRERACNVLKIARDSLVHGLMTERILRENQSLLARRYDLFANIENNLVTLRTLEINSQASEYAELMNQALQIGVSVYQEINSSQRRVSH